MHPLAIERLPPEKRRYHAPLTTAQRAAIFASHQSIGSNPRGVTTLGDLIISRGLGGDPVIELSPEIGNDRFEGVFSTAQPSKHEQVVLYARPHAKPEPGPRPYIRRKAKEEPEKPPLVITRIYPAEPIELGSGWSTVCRFVSPDAGLFGLGHAKLPWQFASRGKVAVYRKGTQYLVGEWSKDEWCAELLMRHPQTEFDIVEGT